MTVGIDRHARAGGFVPASLDLSPQRHGCLEASGEARSSRFRQSVAPSAAIRRRSGQALTDTRRSPSYTWKVAGSASCSPDPQHGDDRRLQVFALQPRNQDIVAWIQLDAGRRELSEAADRIL